MKQKIKVKMFIYRQNQRHYIITCYSDILLSSYFNDNNLLTVIMFYSEFESPGFIPWSWLLVHIKLSSVFNFFSAVAQDINAV